MEEDIPLPRVAINTEVPPVRGENLYTAIPETVEFRPAEPPKGRVRNLGMGRMMLSIDGQSGELVGIHAYVKTGRWKTESAVPPPEPDAEGSLIIDHPFGESDFVYLPIQPAYDFHEESRTLHVGLGVEGRLTIRAADCLLVAVDVRGCLTDIWMQNLQFLPGR